jgi:hypothetical protein
METIRVYRFDFGDDEKEPDDNVRLAGRGAVGQAARISVVIQRVATGSGQRACIDRSLAGFGTL